MPAGKSQQILNNIKRDPHQAETRERVVFLDTPFDRIDAQTALNRLAALAVGAPFRYVVTPNANHVVRLNQTPELRPLYDAAWMSLCDSKPIHIFARARALALPHATGSDLTVQLFKTVIKPGDRLALIVANAAVGEQLRTAYPDLDLRVYVPPMGLLTNAQAQKGCVDFVVDAKARFVFLAVGAPQSEKVAYLLSKQPGATGIGLCIGASLEFLVGAKQRAPQWMQRLSLEWLHRIATDPGRLLKRYAFDTLPLLKLFAQEMRNERVRQT